MSEAKKNKSILNIKSAKNKIGAAAMAAALTAGLAGGTAGDQIINSGGLNPNSDTEIVETLDMVPSEADIVISADEEKKKKKRKLTVKGLIIFVCGWIASLCTGLFASVLTPLGATVLGWIFFALGLFLALFVTVKELFPNASVKKILNKKFLLFYAVLLFVIVALCELLAYKMEKFALWFKLIVLAVAVVVFSVLILKRKNKDKE